MSVETYQSPMGTLYFDVSNRGLTALSFKKPQPSGAQSESNAKLAAQIRCALDKYFAGDFEALKDLPLDVKGTPFQQKVWHAAQKIPAGKPTSYGQLAKKIGHDGASRAVGSALGKNPVVLAVPCHRVLAANGGLGGFTGGLTKKQFLLSHESAVH